MQIFPARSSTRDCRLSAAPVLFSAALSLLALHGGCTNADQPTDMAADLTTPADLTPLGGVVHNVTIRDLNSPTSTLKDGDHVRLTGVVISPRSWVTYDAGSSDYCDYRIFAMQADGTPTTLRDGVALIVSIKTTFTDMSHYSDCALLGQQDPLVRSMAAANLGDLLQIDGHMSHHGKGATATRQVDLWKGSITSQGPAPMMPVPIEADPATYTPLTTGVAQPFVDAQGVLVTFKNVIVNTRDTMYQDFNASTTATGGARIEASYLHAADGMYMSPVDGTLLKSVTGIVTADYKGTIWPGSATDIQQ